MSLEEFRRRYKVVDPHDLAAREPIKYAEREEKIEHF